MVGQKIPNIPYSNDTTTVNWYPTVKKQKCLLKLQLLMSSVCRSLYLWYHVERLNVPIYILPCIKPPSK